MKKIFLFICLSAGLSTLSAQPLNQGKQYYYYQRYTSAESFFHDHLKEQPADAEAWLWLTKSYIQQDKLKNASDSLSLIPQSINNDPYYLVAKGSITLGMKEESEAMTYFNRAIDLTKGKNSAIMNSIAEAHVDAEKGNTSYALEVLQRGLKKDKNNASLYVTMGNVYLKMHDGTEAYKAYANALQKDKNYAEAYYQLGQIFLSQKNTDVYVENFTKAINADKNYSPAYYELYYHYRNTDPARAMQYFNQYVSLSDKTIQQDYAFTDLLYLNKDYKNAISHAQELIRDEADSVQPRLYKLIAYSFRESNDTANAIFNMQQYFRNEHDSNLVTKDFEMLAELYATQKGYEDSAITYYQKAIPTAQSPSTIYEYYKQLALLTGSIKDYEAQASWLRKYYIGNDNAKNTDLFNWGVASYRATDYLQADSAFRLYTEKYPEQAFGYYWQARSNAAIDTALKEGLAIPHYEKLIEVINDDSLTAADKKWVIEAYTYLAAYEINTEQDYTEAMGYLDKVLEVDPENDNAKRYISMLEKSTKKEETDN